MLDRLAIVGKSGMGALTYYPEIEFEERENSLNLDEPAMHVYISAYDTPHIPRLQVP